jgi:hypothetical protein
MATVLTFALQSSSFHWGYMPKNFSGPKQLKLLNIENLPCETSELFRLTKAKVLSKSDTGGYSLAEKEA